MAGRGRLEPFFASDAGLTWLAMTLAAGAIAIGQAPAGQQSQLGQSPPPRVVQAQRFLAHRGMGPGRGVGGTIRPRASVVPFTANSSPSTATWEPLGPAAVLTANYGLVTGRISSLALDPSDLTGNKLYVGTTGGGVWFSQNAATSDATKVVFTPLTDRPAALSTVVDGSISIGALTVQPGGTGVILAGTGDPNDALDSYYGAGVLRSADGGNTWTVIQGTTDVAQGLAGMDHWFYGEGFAGFAWSTVNPQVVAAAVSQSYESSLVDAGLSGSSYSGLYYSNDAGATWHLATITDGNGSDVQGPADAFAGAEGNAATAVVWNPVRNLFIAAVRFHGYYQSSDGVTWTRMAVQPGSGLTTQMCPTNTSLTGSPACPIFRGALAVNPLTGDTFAWTVDLNNQDQGVWQDACWLSAGVCTNVTVTFAKQWSTEALETSTGQGSQTVLNGDYNLALAAVPSNQDTLLLTGANDLWECSLAMGCAWRNTTNSTTCMSAQVGEYQHALEWSKANPLEVFAGNDSGLWRSEDAIGETGPVCSASDASHWQNLNGALGSLAEVESLSAVGNSSYTLMAGLGANGTAGIKSTTAPTTDWPQILGGEGGPVAIDPTNANNWYVNNGAGVSIHLCAKAGACTPADFGNSPVVSDADVDNDGLTMTEPAPFLVDPVDPTQLLIATCRLWRGPASGNGWTGANAITPMLGSGSYSTYCSGNPLIRSMAAFALAGGGEVVYVGTFGSLNGGGNLPGHILKANMSASGTWSGWTDLTLNQVVNDSLQFNNFGLDVSSLYVDPHDATGNTVYATIAGMPDRVLAIRMAYRSTDGGAHWKDMTSNLQYAPANSLVVDPGDTNTAYLATDVGVFATQQVSTCGDSGVNCWAAFGTGLPESPVVQLQAAPTSASLNVLVAGTYGRGTWQIPLLTAGLQMTTGTVSPPSLTFASQPQATASSAQAVTLTNTGGIVLLPTSITASGDFAETDNCVSAAINTGASCTIQVTFSPTATGDRSGVLTIEGNLSGGNIMVSLSGTGAPAGVVTLTPPSIDFGSVEAGTTSAPLSITAENSGGSPVAISSVTVTGPFVLSTNSCGDISLEPSTDCQLAVEFNPATAGSVTGTLTMVDAVGTQTVQLTGTGTAPPTDTLSPTSLTFPGTVIGVDSAAQTITLSNTGGNPLTSIAVTVTGPFQQSNNCTTQLAGPANCSINAVFLPTAAGTQTGTLTVTDILRTQTISLQGTGLLPPAFTVSPTSLTFSGQQVGIVSAPQVLTVTNSGGAAMANVGFQISGTSASNFATGTTTCGASLDAGANCTVQVTFTPSASGAAQGTLTITSSTQQVKAVTVPLNGTGASVAGLSATPPTLTFAAIALGQTSAAQTVTVTNNGGSPAAGLSLGVTGPFALAQNSCGSSLAGGASCTTGVVFAPMQTGALSGALTVTSTSMTTPATVALNGIGGLTGALQMQPAQVSFPTTGVGTTSSPITVTLTNTSTAVSLDKLVLTASSQFNVTSTTCGSSLAAGASCTAALTFAPASVGAQTGTLTITSSELGANAAVPLMGKGFDFTSTTTGSASQTVASGQTATFTLTLSPVGDSGSFTFQCNSLPQYATCVFSPTTLNVADGTTGTETLQITTSQATAALERTGGMPAALPLSLACGLFLLPLACRRRRAWLLVLLGVALAMAGAGGCSGSGGGGGGTPPPPTSSDTPTGTYSIRVVSTSNGVQHTVTLTLVVD